MDIGPRKNNILLDFLYSNSIISPNQFGFLPSRSTTDALIAPTQAIQSWITPLQFAESSLILGKLLTQSVIRVYCRSLALLVFPVTFIPGSVHILRLFSI